MKIKVDTAFAGTLLIIAVVPLVAVYSIVYGATIAQLWLWFVVPTFQAPALNVPQAIGLGILVGFLTNDVSLKKDDRESYGLGASLLAIFGRPLTSLFFGWVLSFWL